MYFMSTACGRSQGVRGSAHVDACGHGEGDQKPDFCGRHKWMALGLVLFVRLRVKIATAEVSNVDVTTLLSPDNVNHDFQMVLIGVYM